MHTYSPSIWETEAGGLGIQGQPWLHSEFQVKLVHGTLSEKEKEGEGARSEEEERRKTQ